jgi:nucleoid DNA-binding protein
MRADRLELIGHDNPLGHYPAPVIPIVQHKGALMAIYARDSGPEVVRLSPRVKFIHHEETLRESLNKFDYQVHRLFAISKELLEFYPIRSEARYLRDLLSRPLILRADPFLRLSIAKGTGQAPLVVKEMISCIRELKQGSEGFVTLWYRFQRENMVENFDSEQVLALPSDWRVLEKSLKLSTGQRTRSTNRHSSSPKRTIPTFLAGMAERHSLPIGRVAGTRAKKRRGMIKSEVVTYLANRCGFSRSEVRKLLADLVTLAIRELKAHGQFQVPGLGKFIVNRADERKLHSARQNLAAEPTLEFRVSYRLAKD